MKKIEKYLVNNFTAASITGGSGTIIELAQVISEYVDDHLDHNIPSSIVHTVKKLIKELEE